VPQGGLALEHSDATAGAGEAFGGEQASRRGADDGDINIQGAGSLR